MMHEERGRSAHAEEEVVREERMERHARTGGTLLAGTVLAWEVGAKLAGAVLRTLTGKPAAVLHAPPGEPPGTEPKDADRADDTNLTLRDEHNLFTRRRWGTFLVLLAFAISFAGGFGFLFAYWTGGSNELLGGMLAMFFIGMGLGMVWWARRLTVHKLAQEPREQLVPPPEQRESAESQFEKGAYEIHRRGLLCWMGAIGLGFMGAFVISMLRSFGFNPYKALYTTVWEPGQRLVTKEGKPISIHDLAPGSTAVVFPENSRDSEKSQTVLVRVQPWMLDLPRERADWAPQGYVAYSRVCTHAGCAVGLYEKTAHLLMCPCHQSTFNVLRAAEPTSGPADRALPQLPLYADNDGYLRAAGGFSEIPGPGFWGLPQ